MAAGPRRAARRGSVRAQRASRRDPSGGKCRATLAKDLTGGGQRHRPPGGFHPGVAGGGLRLCTLSQGWGDHLWWISTPKRWKWVEHFRECRSTFLPKRSGSFCCGVLAHSMHPTVGTGLSMWAGGRPTQTHVGSAAIKWTSQKPKPPPTRVTWHQPGLHGSRGGSPHTGGQTPAPPRPAPPTRPPRGRQPTAGTRATAAPRPAAARPSPAAGPPPPPKPGGAIPSAGR